MKESKYIVKVFTIFGEKSSMEYDTKEEAVKRCQILRKRHKLSNTVTAIEVEEIEGSGVE